MLNNPCKRQNKKYYYKKKNHYLFGPYVYIGEVIKKKLVILVGPWVTSIGLPQQQSVKKSRIMRVILYNLGLIPNSLSRKK